LLIAIPSGRAARVPAKERGCVTIPHAAERRMKESSSSLSPHASDATDHLKRYVLVRAVRLGLVNFHASGASPEAATLLTVKESGTLTFFYAIASLRTKLVLRFQDQAGLKATSRSTRKTASKRRVVSLGAFNFD
jgi:hypothetical protein